MPSAESLRRGEYYGNPRNAFWALMGALFDAGPELAYAERVRRLRLALPARRRDGRRGQRGCLGRRQGQRVRRRRRPS